MSTQINHYVILGVRLPFPKKDQDYYERYEMHMDSAWEPKKNGFVMLYDGMCGNYVVAGHVLASTAADDNGFDEPLIYSMDALAASKVQFDLDRYLGIKDAKVDLIVLSHYR